MTKRGILITNIGTPDAPTIPAVREYLNEFLMDPEVVSIPYVLRRLIVSWILLKRPAESARSYQSIWLPEGSPLLVNCKRLASRIKRQLNLPVAIGMRYGRPSFADAMAELGDVDEVLLVSPYPQYATATVKSATNHARKFLGNKPLLISPLFYNDEAFLDAQFEQITKHLVPVTQHLVFSFHGIPVSQVKKADPTRTHCLSSSDCCAVSSIAHSTCYRHQCLVTAKKLGERVSIPYSVSFQSRIGKAKWLEPYSSDHIKGLARDQGLKHIAVTCPAFTMDNLETLHEVGIELRSEFVAAGGDSLTLIPCVNDAPRWIERVISWCQQPSEALEPVS